MDAMHQTLRQSLARRTFLKQSTTGLGAVALASLFNPKLFSMETGSGCEGMAACSLVAWACL